MLWEKRSGSTQRRGPLALGPSSPACIRSSVSFCKCVSETMFQKKEKIPSRMLQIDHLVIHFFTQEARRRGAVRAGRGRGLLGMLYSAHGTLLLLRMCSCGHLHKIKAVKSFQREPGVIEHTFNPKTGGQSKFQAVLV